MHEILEDTVPDRCAVPRWQSIVLTESGPGISRLSLVWREKEKIKGQKKYGGVEGLLLRERVGNNRLGGYPVDCTVRYGRL